MNPESSTPKTKTVFPQTGWRLALDRSSQFLSVVLLFTVPLITQLDGADPLFPKWAVSQVLVFLILGAWALRIAFTGELSWVYSKALVVLGFLIAWMILTDVLSPYSQIGFQNLSDFLVFPLWYILLTFTCTEIWRAENLLMVFLVSGLATAIWAVCQALGMGTGGWTAIVQTQFKGRVVGGLGNPEFLAGYLLMVWPMAMALLSRTEKLSMKVLWGAVVLFSLTALLWTGSKAGWVGLLAGVMVYILFIWKDKKYKSFKWLTVLAAFVVISIWVSPMASRLKELANVKSDSIQFRKQVWQGTLRMFEARPWLGFGFGTFATAFPDYRPISLMMNQTEKSYEVNHAHNWILEWLAETGVIGFLLLLAFGFFVLAQWWKLYSVNAIPKPLAAGAFAAFAGVAVSNLFDLNGYLPSTLVPLLFLAALPVALSQRFYWMKGYIIRRKSLDVFDFKVYLLPLVALVMVLVFQQAANAFQRQAADIQLKGALTASGNGKWDEAISGYNRTLHLDPLNLEAKYFRGMSYADRATPGDTEKALADLEAVGKLSPDFVLIHYKKAKVLSSLGHMEESEAQMKRAIQLDPSLIAQLPLYQQARQWAGEKRFSNALPIYQKLVFDYPTCVPALVDYGNCLVMTGKSSEAIAVYQKALSFDPANEAAQYNLTRLQALPTR